MIVATSCTGADSSPHFFLTCFDWILPFCNFFRRFGYFVAGFLAVRLTFLDMTTLPLETVCPSI